MNVKRIRILDELLTETMNHWLLYPLPLAVMGIFAKIVGEGNPGLAMWFLCGLFPPVFFLLRCKIKRLIPSVFLHLAVAAAAPLIPLAFPVEKTVCVICVTGYAFYSLVRRLKYDSLYTGIMQLPVAVGISAVSALLQRYQGTQGWDNYYLLPLIAGIALYFIIYYMEHYLDFLAMNDSSAGFLPAREMFHSGMGLVLAYTVFATLILLLGSQFEWLSGILEPIRNLFLRFLRFLFSGHGNEEPEVEMPAEEPMGNDMGGMPLPEGGGTFWLWKVLEVILMAVFFCGVLLLAAVLIWKLFQLIRKYRDLHFSERDVQTEDAFDLREKCELEKASEKRRQRFFGGLSPREKIRKMYKKKILLSSSGLPEEDKSRLNLYTAKEWGKKLEADDMAQIYEQARYSKHEMTGTEVKKMKEACR